MDASFDIGPKPVTGPKLCGFTCCLLPQRRHKQHPDTTRTAPNTPADEDDNDEMPQFFIDADGMPQDVSDNDFWKKFMSILWMLLAAKYWTGRSTPEDGEKSLPPELDFQDDLEEDETEQVGDEVE